MDWGWRGRWESRIRVRSVSGDVMGMLQILARCVFLVRVVNFTWIAVYVSVPMTLGYSYLVTETPL